MSDASVIAWFRRDLRFTDNLALNEALATGKPVIPLFIFDDGILNSERIGAPRLDFMLQALGSLRTELHKHQRELLIRRGNPLTVLRNLVDESGADALFFNLDYTPFARQRDQEICDSLGIKIQAMHDRLLAKPGDILKDDGDPYVVYTPFKKKWRTLTKPDRPETDVIDFTQFHTLDGLENHDLPTLDELEYSHSIDLPEAGEKTALDRLDQYTDQAIYGYEDGRNALGNPQSNPKTQTSFLSPYIRFGLLSLRHIYWASRDAYADTQSEAKRDSVVTFVDEIIWHEFYTHILHHFPQVVTENFYDKFNKVAWRDAPDELDAWKNGETGYPIVDAAMRQLKGTGWMHNRARMIVASFLTKHLLIHWSHGEKHFMQWLLDGDLAANNGGWQWAAGTGTDAQPYFRIFNPISQSKKFDPDGDFIRYWVPELRDLDKKTIHEPWKMNNPPKTYPAPIVDHKFARERALEAFKATKN